MWKLWLFDGTFEETTMEDEIDKIKDNYKDVETVIRALNAGEPVKVSNFSIICKDKEKLERGLKR